MCCFCHISIKLSASLYSDWDNGGVWQPAPREVFEVQLFGREGRWICRADVWMPLSAPDSPGDALFPLSLARQPFIGSTNLLRSSNMILWPLILPPHPCPYLLPWGRRKLESGEKVARYHYLCYTTLSSPWFLHDTSHDSSLAQLHTLNRVCILNREHQLTELWAMAKMQLISNYL